MKIGIPMKKKLKRMNKNIQNWKNRKGLDYSYFSEKELLEFIVLNGIDDYNSFQNSIRALPYSNPIEMVRPKTEIVVCFVYMLPTFFFSFFFIFNLGLKCREIDRFWREKLSFQKEKIPRFDQKCHEIDRFGKKKMVKNAAKSTDLEGKMIKSAAKSSDLVEEKNCQKCCKIDRFRGKSSKVPRNRPIWWKKKIVKNAAK